MKKTGIFAVLFFIILTVPCYSQDNTHYGADYIFKTGDVAVFWAVLKGPDVKSNMVYINIIPLGGKEMKYTRYSAIASNVFSKEEEILVKYKKLESENIIKRDYGSFLNMSEMTFLFYGKNDSKKKPGMEIYYKGVPDAAPEFLEESGITAFFEHSLEKLK